MLLSVSFQFCLYYLVKFCPHDLFVNTRADLGQCTKLHDDEARRLFEEARPSPRKRSYEDEFLRFSNHMINEVDRKIEKGRQRLALMNKSPDATQPQPAAAAPVTKFDEMIDNMNARVNKLISEAEEAGSRGDVEQAQNLMTLCDQVKEEKEALIETHEKEQNAENGTKAQWNEYASNEKQMEVCEVCGAFLIVGDAQQRIEDHLSGKQHLGYSKLRKAVEEMYEQRQKEREKEDKDRYRRDDYDRKRPNRDRSDRRERRRSRSRERSHQRDRRCRKCFMFHFSFHLWVHWNFKKSFHGILVLI